MHPSSQGQGKVTASQCRGARRAGMHRPFYTDSVYGNTLDGDVGFTADLRGALERVFFQYEVACPARALAQRCPALPAYGRHWGGCSRMGSPELPALMTACELSIGGHRQDQRAWHRRGDCAWTEPAERVPAAAALTREAVVLRQVDATWYGHVHQYSRTCPVFQARPCQMELYDMTRQQPALARCARLLAWAARKRCKWRTAMTCPLRSRSRRASACQCVSQA